MWDKMFGSVDLLQNGLSAAWERNAVIRNNIANVETPGFKASNVEFESILARSLENGGFQGKKTRDKHIAIGADDAFSVRHAVTKSNGLSMRMDGNNVDIEAENVKLAQNTILYNTMLEKMNSELRRIKLAINEGR
ncbi:MAG: flagellar basal body rod protein FlgB [Oscillospiraceae bacterium]|jgi:flagellar basal-body rod protein FlgB|nr:flagellar basal body rod protein FlgB [Oscillospiraceae bacterium]